MFFLRTVEHKVKLSPKYFGQGLKAKIAEKLVEEVTREWRTLSGDVCCILQVRNVDFPIIQSHDEVVDFPVEYDCMIYCPIRGEIVEGVIRRVDESGIICNIGPVDCLISKKSFPSYLKYKVFKDEASVTNTKTEIETIYRAEEHLRIKIEGIRHDETGVFATGTISMPFLGLIDTTT